MGYKIDYWTMKTTRTGTGRKRWKRIAGGIGAAILLYLGVRLLPAGELTSLAQNLQQGQSLTQAVTTFCQELTENGR